MIGFAHEPPSDTSFLTTRMWDKYLPGWRTPSPTLSELPKDLLEKLNAMWDEASGATPAHDEHDVDKLEFVTLSKQVSTKKGSYLRYSKETILKMAEWERSKAESAEIKVPKVYPPGSAFNELVNQLKRLGADPRSSNVEICLMSGKRDASGEKLIQDGVWAAEVRRFGADASDEDGVDALKQEYERLPVLEILILLTRYGTGQLGMAKFSPSDQSGQTMGVDNEEWVKKAVLAYVDSHGL